MILSRTSFTLRFGQARPAIALWKQIMDVEVSGVDKMPMRLLTDVSGPNYTLVSELGMRGFTDLGPGNHTWMSNERIRELYPQFVPLCERSVSDLFHVEHQVGEPLPAGGLVERMTFQLHYGKAKDAILIWREVLNVIKASGKLPHARLLTDVTGPSYRLVMELHYRSMMDFGPKMGVWLSEPRLGELHQQFTSLCTSADRTLFRIEHVA
jgi:hypothetical protein